MNLDKVKSLVDSLSESDTQLIKDSVTGYD
ncbi:hypothetical protein M2387_001022 [Klebsiella sp. BIGb0407]|nr:hypothetical protein [Klebsiella sp. BIGb0407]